MWYVLLLLASSWTARSECVASFGPTFASPPAGPAPNGTVGDAPIIVSVRQLDLSCPTARSCPGSDGVADLCAKLRDADLFDCAWSWSTGATGDPQADLVAIGEFVTESLDDLCGACAKTLSLSTSLDAEVDIVT